MPSTANPNPRRASTREAVNGWVILDKGLTVPSTKAVNIIRRAFNAAKAGHAGTLDPLATGILPIALGEATKTIPYVMDATKDYLFTVKWGEATDTDDREGEVIARSETRPDEVAIREALPRFSGRIDQVPPRYSAIKKDGRRAYDLARADIEVNLSPRKVDIHELVMIEATKDEASFRVTTGKGAYIRALARDLARDLGTEGHVIALRRTRVGPFSEARSISLDFFDQIDNSADAFEALHPVLTALADIPAFAISENDAHRLRCGQKIAVSGTSMTETGPLEDDVTALALCDGTLVAIISISGGTASPSRVFNLP
ncbi:tRNA pseudouridine(55) synthase TruB [Alphaproteobacteria bacterium LSUCC0684]